MADDAASVIGESFQSVRLCKRWVGPLAQAISAPLVHTEWGLSFREV